MLNRTIGIAAAIGIGTAVVGLGVAQAAPARPTAAIRSTIYCYSGPYLNTSSTLSFAVSATTQTSSGSGAALISGSMSGLTPGRTYVYLSSQGNLFREPEETLGTATSDGRLSFRYVTVLTDPESGGTLHAGRPDSYQIFDAAMIGNSTAPTPVLTGKTSAITVNTTCGTLRAGSVQTRLVSYNGKYILDQQTDGNLVLRQGTAAVWSTKTAGHPGAYTVMQPDGNLVVRSAAGGALWNSKTAGHPGSYLELQTDRNLVIYEPTDPGPKALWQSNTN